MTPLLQTSNLVASYGDFQALFGINLAVHKGETIALIGSNGAGKTTTLKTITGLIPARANDVLFMGEPIGGLAPERIIPMGIALVPEGRRLFPSLSVEENLRMGANCGRQGLWTLDRVFQLFPVMAERRNASATSLSGGQQQMVAIGRALMANPSLLLCDEISLGLSPTVIRDLYVSLRTIREEGTTIIIVEQDINRALKFSDRVYCLQEGKITLEGRPDALTREEIKLAYFGI
jgi:branched-chain amino acid transport system ATP-binding protein